MSRTVKVSRSPTHSDDKNALSLSRDTFLQTFPMPAFLISGSNARIIASNGLATGADGPPEGRTCHEALAGRATPCEFCPLSQMLAGNADPYTRVNQARFGRRTAVSVRPVILTDKTILVLELVEDLGALPESLGNQLRTEEFEPHDSESAALLYYIARLILKRGASRRKLTRIIDMLEKYSDELKHSGLWIEIDGNYAGRATGASEKGRTITGIEVNRTARGRIGAQEPSRLGPGSKALLAQCAAMLSRRMEIEDRLLRIGRATLKSRRRAANLAREMWNRTEALAKETGYLQGILNSSQDIIITTDLEGRIVEFNPGAENRLGFTAEEMYGRLVTDLWENAEEREEIMKVVSSRGSVSNHETRLRTKSGEFVEISLTLSKLIDSEGRVLGTVGVSKDISREVAIRRELEAMNQNFRETINFISHESKNSLMVIGGFIRRLLNNEADPQKAEQLKIVYHHSKFLEAMSRDFLVMSDLEQGNLHCRKEWIEDVREEVIIPAMIGLKERYPDSFEKYEPEPDDIPKVSLMGNRDLLEIVFRNLFGNALKYMKPGGKIRYGIKPYLEGYLFNVWNDGPGIPNSETEKIFEKFYRIHDENTKGKRGTGLGLYNIRKIIEGHKGRIWCETEPGEWINFLFTIPGNNTGASND